ncbi:ATP-binding cassette domain-containing protein [Acaricomes phytoseiuli]|uniref:ABC transporter ATP-binding protein n=1 Tax=Acaricomes phytoseiuli TaxID=291968 RepID=UPI00037A46BD|nr:ATP-binding cassette domain-containing protein [Acaricomes phytoseiuli]MCW1249584.1 ATP-binding cassette domain-containing protein [Acaricomes phytoseiuli]
MQTQDETHLSSPEPRPRGVEKGGKTLTLEGVTRAFNGRPVLQDVSFSVQPGRLTGFVGANGAGKTTTMRIILGVLSMDRGEVSFGGEEPQTAARRRFGYMPEERGLYPKMQVGEQLEYFGRLHGLSPAEAKSRTAELIERLGLSERIKDLVEKLSLGNQQRVQIAAALIHDPELLVLDEPFSGLDPVAVETVLGVLQDYARTGVPVLFSSHQLDVVERLCDDVVILADGTIRAAGSREALRSEYSGSAYEIEVAGDIGWIRQEPGVQVAEFDGGYARFEAPSEAAQRVLAEAARRSEVRRFAPVQPTLAEIFKEVIA